MGAAHLSLASWNSAFYSFALNPFIMATLLFYGTSLLLWVYTLSSLPLMVMTTFNCLTYVGVLLMSAFFFNETLTHTQLLGVLMVVGGVFLVASRA